MRPAHAFPLLRRLALAGSLAAALAGCSRDLELPGVPSGPTLQGSPPFSPPAAHAGELLRITATHLEADATANTVHFAGASARGERFDGGELLVRVPADAGDGPLTVSNRDGTSAASPTPFDYLGLGEPRRRQVSSATPILHRPVAVHAVAGDVVLHSSLYGGLVWAGAGALTTPAIVASAGDPSRGLLYYADTDPAAGTPRLLAVDAASGALAGIAALDEPPAQILPLPSSGVVLTFHWDALAGVEEVAAWDADDLASVFAPSAYGIDFFFGAADLGDGRVVIAGIEPSAWDFTLSVLAVGPALPAPPAPAVPALSPPPIALAGTGLAPLAVGRASGANALLGVDAGAHLAAVALEDGDVAVANLDVTPPEFVLTVETWSAAPVESIAAAPEDGALGAQTGVALATKPGDDLAVGFDLATGTLLWSVAGSAPTVASADGPFAFMAQDGDNDVSVVNLATGARVARVNFDVRPRAAGYRAAAAFLPFEDRLHGELLFPADAFPALLRLPTDTGEPALVARGTSVDFVEADPATGSAWAASSGAPAIVAAWSGADWGAATTVDLPGAAAPRWTAARGGRLVVGHEGGLSLLEGATLLGSAAVPGASDPVFAGLGFAPGGDVWAVVQLDGGLGVEVQRWTADAIAAGGTPGARRVLPGTPSATATVLSAAWLEDGLWVFWEDDAQAAWATLLDGALAEVRTVPASGAMRSIDATSPNGRLLVHRELGKTLGYVLRFFRADPDAGFPEVGSLVFAERVEGFAFDATGERLYVITQLPDRVVTVD